MRRSLFVWMLTLSALRASASGQIDRPHRVDDLELAARKGPLDIYTPLVSLGDAVYFGATDLASGEQLWRSDGTAEGTRKIRDFNVLGYPPPEGFAAVGSRLFFFVDGGLWQIDPSGQVALVTNLPLRTRPGGVAAAGSQLFFAIDDGVHGVELWKSDGTPEGTSLVSDIEPGAGSSGPTMLTPLGDTLFFFASDSAGGYSLWRTDGTASGTQRVRGLPGAGVGDGLVTTLSGTLLFIAGDPNDAALPFRLWRSDGTPEGTIQLAGFVGDSASICPGYCFPYGPSDLTALGDLAFFIANDGVHGRELWKTDGTVAGTVLVKDVFPGKEAGLYGGLSTAGGLLYFNGEDPDHGVELWRSDGSEAGTHLVEDFVPGPDSSYAHPLAELGGRLLFTLGNSDELFATDGTAAGTRSIRDFGPSLPGSAFLIGSAPLGNGALLFVRWDGSAPTLWRTDGSTSGTTLVPVEALRTPRIDRIEIVRVEPRPPATRAVPPRR